MGQANEKLPTAGEALPGREDAIRVAANHYVTGNPVEPTDGALEHIVVGTGCFWGTEKGFWRMPGVTATSVGYCAGLTKNPTYKEVCSGKTGHNEVVLIAFNPEVISYEQLLAVFWESHDPTQGMRQGSVGTAEAGSVGSRRAGTRHRR